MTRTVKVLPEELTNVFYLSGDRKVIALEGHTDVDVFELWYEDRKDEIYLHDSGGSIRVLALVELALANKITHRVFGILDRDYREDSEIDAALADPNAHIFILCRYAIENYLLEPPALFEEARLFLRRKIPFKSANEVEAAVLQLCVELKSLVAANWVLIEDGKERLPDGYPHHPRDHYVDHVAAMVGCGTAEADAKLAAKESRIEHALDTLENAHTRISGKHLFSRVCTMLNQHTRRRERTGSTLEVNRPYLRALLCYRIVSTPGIHPDIRAIVEDRVLNA
jgi:hypothetical protein